MAARVWASPATDGLLFHNDSVSLCLLVNRRAGTMRVFDFRAGVASSKRTFLLSTARRERIERVFIIVEREEVSTWSRLGLVREGSIPAFYKRSDAFLLGGLLDLDGVSPLDRTRKQACAADQDRAEETLRKARLHAKRNASDAAPMAFKLLDGDEGAARRAVWLASRTGTGLTSFEPFGRDCTRRYFVGTLRAEQPLWLSAEIQPCFDHALLELLTAPRSDREWTLCRTALQLAASRLRIQGVVGMFAFSATDDVLLASAFVAAGFRRTGVLANHLSTPSGRKDAFLWSQKHALPGQEDD